MTVLVACEFSGVVRDAFGRRGHDAVSCDLLPTERPGRHFQRDVLKYLRWPWDLVIAHPPCTRLCNSGVRWLHERGLWAELDAACEFFRACYEANTPRVAVENPTMHRHALERIGIGAPDFALQPWEHGHGETKRTCFWTRGLPALRPSNVVDGRAPRVHRAPPSADRWKERSRTYEGVAEAMAEQWGAA